MLGIPRRFAHFVFGVIQSGLTSAIAAAIASAPFLDKASFLSHWIRSWLLAWFLMLPLVIFAAPGIRNLSNWLTRAEDQT
jgi:Mn2+/Fe2+ NRAMP family transporter